MKKLLLLCMLVSTGAFAQDRGTKTPYSPSDTTDTPAPTGYIPYFINYIGRHGARHVTSLKELSVLDHFLRDAASGGYLTAQGDTLKERVARILSVEKNYIPGDLTQTGRDEQTGIGRRMRAHYPNIGSGACLNITYTEEARTHQSEESFMSGFLPEKAAIPSGAADGATGAAAEDATGEATSGAAGGLPACARIDTADSVHLRFFELSPRYKAFSKNGSWSNAMDRLLETPAYQGQLKQMVARWFIPGFNHWSDKVSDPSTLAEAVYAAASITGGLTHELAASGYTPESVNVFALLTDSEIQWLALIGGAKDFLVKGPGFNPDGIQVRDAVPLLVDLVRSTDSALHRDAAGANLRFAHAETVAPIAALLGLEGAATPDTDLRHYTDVWKAGSVICFSANVQWIVYRAANAPDLIKVLYNEHPVHLPIKTNAFPYYKWEDVHRFYKEKLYRLGIGPDTDLYQYLIKLH